jgi:hypothetical protein
VDVHVDDVEIGLDLSVNPFHRCYYEFVFLSFILCMQEILLFYMTFTYNFSLVLMDLCRAAEQELPANRGNLLHA